MRIKKLLLIQLLSWGLALQVQAQFSVDAEYRFNPVYSRGFRQPLFVGEKPGFYTQQRTRLILGYNKPEDIKMEIILQDRRFWGDQNARAEVSTISVFRAWVEKYFTPQLSLKMGRQGLIYDDGFLFGELNWGGTMAHDAALLKYESESLSLHFCGVYNANGGELKREHYEHTMPKAMQFVWLKKELGPLKTAWMLVNHGMETADTVVHFTQTIGATNSLSLSDKLSLKGVYYYQAGQNVKSQHVNAYLMSAQIMWDATEQFSFNAGVDISSGTSQTTAPVTETTESNTFNRYFGLLHAQFGYLDYFFVKQATSQGLKDFYLKTKWKYGSWAITDDVHSFYSDKAILHTASATPMNKYYGLENDLLINYKMNNSFKVSLGHSIMFGTDTFEQFFGGKTIKDSQFVYAVITAKTKFL